MRAPRSLLLALASVLALAGAAGIGCAGVGWAELPVPIGTAGPDHGWPAGGYGIGAAEAPLQVPAPRVDVLCSTLRAFEREPDPPPPQFSPSGRDAQRVAEGSEAVHISRQLSFGLAYDAALARSGSLSSFGTSLPPPPHA